MSTGRGQPGGKQSSGEEGGNFRGRGRGRRGGRIEAYGGRGGGGGGGYAGRGAARDTDDEGVERGGTTRGGYSGRGERGTSRGGYGNDGEGAVRGGHPGRGATRGGYSTDPGGGERGGYAGQGASRGRYGTDGEGSGVVRGGYAGATRGTDRGGVERGGATKGGYGTDRRGVESGGYAGRGAIRGEYGTDVVRGGHAGRGATRGGYSTDGGEVERGGYPGRGATRGGYGTNRGRVERGGYGERGNYAYGGRGGIQQSGHSGAGEGNTDGGVARDPGIVHAEGTGGRGGGAYAGRRGGGGATGGERGFGGARGTRRSRPIPDPGLFDPVGAPVANIDTLKIAKSNADQIIAQLVEDGGWEEDQLPLRPGFGTAGVETAVRTNYFKVESKSLIYEYEVLVRSEGKEATGRDKKSRLFELIMKAPELTGLVGGPAAEYIAHDSNKIILSAKKLKIPDRATYDFDIRYYTTDEGPSDGDIPYQVQISMKRLLNPQDLEDYAQGKAKNYDSTSIIRALDTILVNIPTIPESADRTHTFNIGPKRYITTQSPNAELGIGMVAYRGYYSSVRTSFGAVLCNINVCTGAFFKPMNLGALITQLWGSGARGDGDQFPINGLKVTTMYTGRRKVFEVLGVGSRSAAQQMFFWQEEGREVSVKYYFERRYNVRLRNPNWLCIKRRIGNTIAFIPSECCDIVERQIVKQRLPGDYTTAMLAMACRSPKPNAELIVGEGMEILGYKANSSNPLLRNFAIRISEYMEATSSRILPVPSVKYRASSAQIANNSAGWNLRGVKFSQGGVLTNWVVMVLQDPGGSYLTNPDSYVAQLVRMCQTSGVNVVNSRPRVTVCDLPARVSRFDLRDDAAQAMAKTLDSICNSASQKPKFLLVFLSNEDKNVYNHLKFLVDCKFGIPTVCCQSAKVQDSRGRGQYLGNIALKVNVKTGGRNHELRGDALALLGVDSLVLGADVTHPASSSDPKNPIPSIAGVVGSYENSYSLYPGCLRLQKSKQEMIQYLDEQVVERLHYYQANNPSKRLPAKIWYFRDGVSDGQFEQVNQHELRQIKDACAEASGNDPAYKPKIIIIVCGKRHHTRFYPTDMQHSDGKGNCAPGTVVDRGVTSVYHNDFYLQAHVALQGTARSTHYTVTYNEVGLTADGLQQLIHNMSYLFARATKAVSYAPPAYYADILCERGLCYLQALTSPVNQNESVNISEEASGREGHEIGNERHGTRRGRNDGVRQRNFMEEAKRLWGEGPNPEVSGLMFYI